MGQRSCRNWLTSFPARIHVVGGTEGHWSSVNRNLLHKTPPQDAAAQVDTVIFTTRHCSISGPGRSRGGSEEAGSQQAACNERRQRQVCSLYTGSGDHLRNAGGSCTHTGKSAREGSERRAVGWASRYLESRESVKLRRRNGRLGCSRMFQSGRWPTQCRQHPRASPRALHLAARLPDREASTIMPVRQRTAPSAGLGDTTGDTMQRAARQSLAQPRRRRRARLHVLQAALRWVQQGMVLHRVRGVVSECYGGTNRGPALLYPLRIVCRLGMCPPLLLHPVQIVGAVREGACRTDPVVMSGGTRDTFWHIRGDRLR